MKRKATNTNQKSESFLDRYGLTLAICMGLLATSVATYKEFPAVQNAIHKYVPKP